MVAGGEKHRAMQGPRLSSMRVLQRQRTMSARCVSKFVFVLFPRPLLFFLSSSLSLLVEACTQMSAPYVYVYAYMGLHVVFTYVYMHFPFPRWRGLKCGWLRSLGWPSGACGPRKTNTSPCTSAGRGLPGRKKKKRLLFMPTL